MPAGESAAAEISAISERKQTLERINHTVPGTPETAVALGYFDGVHLGHAAVLSAAVSHGGGLPTAVTFESLPRKAGRRLYTAGVKERRLRALGIRQIVCLEFDKVKDQTPQAFVQYLKTHLRATFVSCGYNFRFGKNAAGDAALLESLCRAQGIECMIMPKVVCCGETVSSTRIRRLLAQGDIETANMLLGSPYEFDFPVETGDRRGREWGFPTINQRYDSDFALPLFGVYASSVFAQGQWRAGVTNIGCRPMFETTYPLAETHILHFHSDLYGKTVPVRLHAYLRGEKKHESVQALKEQIRKDSQTAEKIFESLQTAGDAQAPIKSVEFE